MAVYRQLRMLTGRRWIQQLSVSRFLQFRPRLINVLTPSPRRTSAQRTHGRLSRPTLLRRCQPPAVRRVVAGRRRSTAGLCRRPARRRRQLVRMPCRVLCQNTAAMWALAEPKSLTSTLGRHSSEHAPAASEPSRLPRQQSQTSPVLSLLKLLCRLHLNVRSDYLHTTENHISPIIPRPFLGACQCWRVELCGQHNQFFQFATQWVNDICSPVGQQLLFFIFFVSMPHCDDEDYWCWWAYVKALHPVLQVTSSRLVGMSVLSSCSAFEDVTCATEKKPLASCKATPVVFKGSFWSPALALNNSGIKAS